MTESLHRVGQPSRSTDSHGRTDGRTDEEATHLAINPSSNASRAGGLTEFIESATPQQRFELLCLLIAGDGSGVSA